MRLVWAVLVGSLACISTPLPSANDVVALPDLATAPPNLTTAPPDLSTAPPDSAPPPAGDMATPVFPPPPPPVFDQVTVPAGAGVTSIATGDVNGDGVADLVTANRNDFVSTSSGDVETISVIFSGGDGTFLPQTKYQEPLYPITVVEGDFNHDGKLDVVTDSGTEFAVRFNQGGGILGGRLVATDNTKGAPAFVIADIDGDGKLDLVETELMGDTIVHLGNGDGTFRDGPRASLSATYLQAGDFDEDGRADIAYISQPDNWHAFAGIALGRADGSLLAGDERMLPGWPQSMVVADADGDGHLDMLAALNYDTHHCNVHVWLGDGQGGVRRENEYVTGGCAQGVASGDFNRDGVPDLLVSNYWEGNVVFLGGVAGGWFTAAQTVTTGLQSPSVLVSGDFDHDGKMDAALGSPATDSVIVFFNRSP